MTQPSDKLPMPLEDQVCSLELSKRLKELGVKQESWSYHAEELVLVEINDDTGHYETGCWMPVISGKERETEEFRIICSAFTIAELGKQLPSNLDEFVRENLDDLNKELYFDWCNTDHPYYNPDLLAKMLICLLENKLI